MSELNKNVNDDNYYDAKTIRNQSDEVKLSFINNVIRGTEIPTNFVPTWKTNNTRKMFYRIKNGNEEKREWVLFENNHFYCAYCLCFALQPYRFVKGVEYMKGGRTTESLRKHDEESHHKHAMGIYLKLNVDFREETSQPKSPKRVVLRAILKIIIFIATHGKWIGF